uniref:Uncharacterized protein n=1 Tax=Rhizophora mucronata TaxID=61149 RepID=A0A2P2KFJ6_RHIMU
MANTLRYSWVHQVHTPTSNSLTLCIHYILNTCMLFVQCIFGFKKYLLTKAHARKSETD